MLRWKDQSYCSLNGPFSSLAGGQFKDRLMFRRPPHLVQGEHGEHRPIVGFDRFQQQRFLPDVNVSGGSTREHQRLAAAVTNRHHGLRTPDAPEHTALEGQTAAWRTDGEAVHEKLSLYRDVLQNKLYSLWPVQQIFTCVLPEPDVLDSHSDQFVHQHGITLHHKYLLLMTPAEKHAA